MATMLTGDAVGRAGPYELDRILGRGASSIVVRGRDSSDPALLRAIKILHQPVDEQLLREEFGRLSRLSHPNLIKVHDIGRLQQPVVLDGTRLDSGLAYQVMDLLDGPQPVAHLQSCAPQQREQRLLRLARQLAEALGQVHGSGLVHHDVKPANVRLNADGDAVLMDLGLATLTRQHGAGGRGTLAYMAPEALAGLGDHRVDLYGLGATLFELVTGRPPFDGDGATLVQQILERQPRLDNVPWLSAGMRALILALLRKDPAQRPGSSRSVLAHLAQVAGDSRQAARLASQTEVHPPAFVGRRPQLNWLAGQLEQQPQRMGLLLVVGDAGQGKTRLIREALLRHRLRVAAGQLPRRELLTGGLRQVLRQLGQLTGELARWVDDESAGPPDGVALQALDRLQAHARQQAAVVHLEHEPGSESVTRRLLAALAQEEQREPEPALTVVAELLPEAAERGSLSRSPRTEQLQLPPLSAAEVSRLVATMLGVEQAPERLSQWVAKLSRGNPQLAVELTWLFSEEGAEGLDLGRVEGLEAIAARGRPLLQRTELLVMDAVALWDAPATQQQLSQLTELPLDQLWPACQRLTRRGRLVLEPGGRVSLPSRAHGAAWRQLQRGEDLRPVHRRAAGLLRERPGPRARYRCLLHRVQAGDSTAAEPAVEQCEVSLRAGDTVQAERLLAQLRKLSLSEALAARSTQLQVRVFTATGRYAEALALLPQGGSELLRAEILQKSGDYAGAESVLRAWLPGALAPDETRRGAALLARLMLGQGRAAEAARVVQPHLAQGAQDCALLEAAGMAQWYLGQTRDAGELFRRGEAAAVQGEVDLRQQSRMVSLRGAVALSEGALPEAAELYQQASQLARKVGDVHGRATYLANLGGVQLELGRWREALRHLSRATRDLARLARTTELASAHCNLANLLLQLGDHAGAQLALERAEQDTRALQSQHTAAYVEMLQGDLLRAQGRGERATERYQQALATFSELGAARELVDCTLARVDAVSDSAAAEQAQQTLSRLWRESPERHGEVAASWLRLALRQPRVTPPAAAERALARRCAELERQQARKDLLRCATILGAWIHRRRHDPQSAQRALARAKQALEFIMSETPDVYRDQVQQGAEAELLTEEWEALVRRQPKAAPGGARSQESGAPQPQDRGAVRPHEPRAARPHESRPGLSYDRRWVRRLLSINKRLNSELRLPRLLELIMDTVIDLTEAERGFLLLRESDGSLAIKVARNIDQRSLAGEEISLSRSIAEQAVANGEPVVAVDAAEDQRFQAALSVSDLRLRSVLAVPLRVKGRTVGTIYVDHRLRQGVFGEAEVGLVQDVADQAAIAVDNARLLAENQRKAEQIEALNARLQQKVDHQQVELAQIREELRNNRQALQTRYDYDNIVGQTPKMRELFQLLDRVTETALPVVVEGESGTGKELVARAIHQNGSRAGCPFVGENCGAIPETLLESVLFGHVKGAFTGAERERKGLFEVASGGTLFLDEVGEMSPAMQTKLLRVLQNGELRRVGGTETIRTDVRIIAASNRDLKQMVAQNRFREDLFYRLNVIQIRIPPLRERREDIPLLVEHFLRKHAPEPRRVSGESLALLMGYAWPGNVRELENEIMRAAALGGELIGPDDLSPQVCSAVPLALADPEDLDLRARVEHLEMELIRRALRRTGGNHTRSAKLLGLSRYGLLKKMQRFGMAPKSGSGRKQG